MEPNEVYVFSPAVFRNFQKIQYTEEPGGLGQLGCDIREPDGFDRIHFDFSVCIHRVSSANLDVKACPDADAAGDVTAANSFA